MEELSTDERLLVRKIYGNPWYLTKLTRTTIDEAAEFLQDNLGYVQFPPTNESLPEFLSRLGLTNPDVESARPKPNRLPLKGPDLSKATNDNTDKDETNMPDHKGHRITEVDVRDKPPTEVREETHETTSDEVAESTPDDAPKDEAEIAEGDRSQSSSDNTTIRVTEVA